MKKTLVFSLLFSASLLLGCSKKKDAQPDAPGSGAWRGTLVHNRTNNISQFSFGTKTDATLTPGYDPVRLADGSTLYVNASSSAFNDRRRLEVINATGNKITIIADAGDANSLAGPKVSPDGTKIAFTYTDYVRTAGLPIANGTVVIDFQANYVAGVEGYFSPDWLPDGRLILAGDYDSNYSHTAPTTPSAKAGLYVGTLTNQTISLQPLPNVTRNPTPILPTVSPDGRRIAFIQNSHAWVINTDGSGLRQLTTAQDSQEGPMAWAPDGQHLAVWCFRTFETTYYSALAVVPTTGTAPVSLEAGADVWPRTADGFRLSGGWGNFSWR